MIGFNEPNFLGLVRVMFLVNGKFQWSVMERCKLVLSSRAAVFNQHLLVVWIGPRRSLQMGGRLFMVDIPTEKYSTLHKLFWSIYFGEDRKKFHTQNIPNELI